jgi:hypothetical protein
MTTAQAADEIVEKHQQIQNDGDPYGWSLNAYNEQIQKSIAHAILEVQSNIALCEKYVSMRFELDHYNLLLTELQSRIM